MVPCRPANFRTSIILAGFPLKWMSRSIAEVLGGSVPSAVEERANAFAAEFLLPEVAAGDVYRNTADVQEAFKRLAARFGVTYTLAAWQILKHFGEASPAVKPSDYPVLYKTAGRRRA